MGCGVGPGPPTRLHGQRCKCTAGVGQGSNPPLHDTCPSHAGAVTLHAGKGDVFLMAATLRPETMYGQTNAWIRPVDPKNPESDTGKYGAYRCVPETGGTPEMAPARCMHACGFVHTR